MNALFEWTMGWAEVQVQAGKYEESGDFGARYEGFSYSFSAQQDNEKDAPDIALYNVTVTVNAPYDERSMTFFTYATGIPEGG